ncbi:MAG: rubrerythrin family protein [Chloroflexi bacterium]|nr:rubrerythrin family protein [Chloroflexota bacterium]
MSQTQDNLKAAFAGESQANRRYLFFAEAADKSGDKRVARLFRAAAEAETVHARNHLGALGEIKTSRQNLEAAVSGEHYEFTSMYPGFIQQASAEKNQAAGRSFDLANKVERIHYELFQKALAELGSGGSGNGEPYFVCQVCGNTVEKEAPEKCPVCASPRSAFKRID